MSEMIFEREFEVTLTDEMKVEHLVFTYNDNELIIERTHTEPEEGEEDMWNNTDLEILEYDGDDMTVFMGIPLFQLFSAFLRDNGYKFEVTNTKFGREIKKYEGIEKKNNKFGVKYTINYDILMKYLIKMSYVEEEIDDFEVI